MRILIPLIWAAGAVQLIILAANFFLPRILRPSEQLANVSPLIREIFFVHSIYIVFVLAIFITLSFGFAPELAGASSLGRLLSAAMALFWLARVPIQLCYYDRATRRKNRVADVGFLAAFSFLAIIFSLAATAAL